MLNKEKRSFRLTKIVHSIMQQVFWRGSEKAKQYLKKNSTFILQMIDNFLPNFAK